MNKEKFINKLNEELEELKGKELLYFNMRDSVQEARCTNRIFGIQYALNCARLLDEPQKVKVPAFVADYIKWCRDRKWQLHTMVMPSNAEYFESHSESSGLHEWINENYATFLIAIATGDYEVEEEPKYRVLFPCDKRKTGHQFSYLMEDGRQCYCSDLETIPELTESTIKSIDERYWPFAVPVEKV